MAKVIFEERVNILNDILYQPSVYVYLSSHARNELYAENQIKATKSDKEHCIIISTTRQLKRGDPLQGFINHFKIT